MVGTSSILHVKCIDGVAQTSVSASEGGDGNFTHLLIAGDGTLGLTSIAVPRAHEMQLSFSI